MKNLRNQRGFISLGGATLLGAGLSFLGGGQRNRAQTSAANRQMDFQAEMSNTAHQRQMADLEAAGLNPILAAKLGGASSPGGAMPQIQDVVTPAINTGLDIYSKGTEAEKKGKEIEMIDNLMASAEVSEDLADYMQGMTGKIDSIADRITDGIAKTIKLGWEQQQAFKQQLKTFARSVQKTQDDISKKILEFKAGAKEMIINIQNDMSGLTDIFPDFGGN